MGFIAQDIYCYAASTTLYRASVLSHYPPAGDLVAQLHPRHVEQRPGRGPQSLLTQDAHDELAVLHQHLHDSTASVEAVSIIIIQEAQWKKCICHFTNPRP